MLGSEDSPTVGYCMGLCFLICHNLCVREARVVGRKDRAVPLCTGGWVSTACCCCIQLCWLRAGAGQVAYPGCLPKSHARELEVSGWNVVFVIKLLSTVCYLEECTEITKWKIRLSHWALKGWNFGFPLHQRLIYIHYPSEIRIHVKGKPLELA